MVADTLQDKRFCNNPLVPHGSPLRFYAGQPITSKDGCRIATLSVLHYEPRSFGPRELLILQQFAKLVETEINHAVNHQAPEEVRHVVRLLDVEHRTALILADMKPPAESLQSVLKIVCEYVGCSCGFLFEPDHPQPESVLSYSWFMPSSNCADFAARTQVPLFDTFFGRTATLAAQVKPRWIADLSTARDVRRAADAAKAGLRSAVTLPIVAEDQLLSVMELFCDEMREPDQYLAESLTSIGRLIGQYLERTHREARVSRLIAALDTIFSLSPDGLIAFDHTGHATYINASLLGLLGLDATVAKSFTEAHF